MFLSTADLEQLTGFRRPASQLAWLQRNGVPHYRNGRGKHVVPVDAVAGQKRTARPDLSKLT
jgi:carbohydrate-selective porin OprB